MQLNKYKSRTRVPIVIRIAGLPAEEMSCFSSDLCSNNLVLRARLQRMLEEARAQLVREIHTLVPKMDADQRRFFLAVKRHAFNQRSLSKLSLDPKWKLLVEQTKGTATHVCQLEQEVKLWKQDFVLSYERALKQERSSLSRFKENRYFLRGLAVASTSMMKSMHLIASKSESPCRKQRKAESSLLRYISRAALKLSPYSTFTRAGFGLIVRDGNDRPHLRLRSHGWSEDSLLRVNRFFLDQVQDVLLKWPLFHQKLRIKINDTVKQLSNSKYYFVRSGYWDGDPASENVKYMQDTLVAARFHGRAFDFLHGLVRGHGVLYNELIRKLEERLYGEEKDKSQGLVYKLLDLGFLKWELPWGCDAFHLEQGIYSYLKSLIDEGVFADNDDFKELTSGFDTLINLEMSYSKSEDPIEIVKGIDAAMGKIWSSAIVLSKIDAIVEPTVGKRGRLYEDVVLKSYDEKAEKFDAIFQISREKVDEILGDVKPLVRISSVFNRRAEFLYAVREFLKFNWPQSSEIGILEFFRAAQPLWRNYMKFIASERGNEDRLRKVFNPYKIEEVEDIFQTRNKICDGLNHCFEVKGKNNIRILKERLEDLLIDVPDTLKPIVGPCLLIQPGDAQGSTWVLNWMFEGTGRLSSRYTAVMAKQIRQELTEHLAARSHIVHGGEPFELLDLMCARGDTLNIHAVQTRKILNLTGKKVALPESQQLKLRDLCVRLGGAKGLPYLIDNKGVKYLPVHLGVANTSFMPVLVKFLSMFGPGESPAVFPPRKAKKEGDSFSKGRMSIGNVVIKRKRWTAPVDGLRAALEHKTEAEKFLVVNQWRSANRIPQYVFYHEIRSDQFGGETTCKPQFVDFSSPLFVSVFMSSLHAKLSRIVFEEMLPKPDSYLNDKYGKRWATEMILDSLALRPIEDLGRRNCTRVNGETCQG